MILETAEKTLRQRLTNGRMSIPQAAEFVSQVLTGLEELHTCKIIHLDIKPENIFRVKDARTGDWVARINIDRFRYIRQGDI